MEKLRENAKAFRASFLPGGVNSLTYTLKIKSEKCVVRDGARWVEWEYEWRPEPMLELIPMTMSIPAPHAPQCICEECMDVAMDQAFHAYPVDTQ